MKKAKIMLAAIAVLVVVGGALAFKASPGAIYVTNGGALCETPVALFSTQSSTPTFESIANTPGVCEIQTFLTPVE